MKKIFLLGFAALLITATSCKKYLDVQPEGQIKADVVFNSYTGYADALNGCYIKLKDRKLYGEKLTMTEIESLANLWGDLSQEAQSASFQLSNFNYGGANARPALSSIYENLYGVIAQTNMIISHLKETGSVITDPRARALIEGEAHAIRAFCHMDILRLFGQVPNGTTQVSLPYAENVSVTDFPMYYEYNQFLEKLKADLDKAELLFKAHDPVVRFTFSQMNSFEGNTSIGITDTFLGFRQQRFNYWAVIALKARLALYTGNKIEAYTLAKSVRDAKAADGSAIISLSGLTDLPSTSKTGYRALPTESLLMLNAYNLRTYTPSILATGGGNVVAKHYTISGAQLAKLYEGQDTTIDNRAKKFWYRGFVTNGNLRASLAKYYYSNDEAVGGVVEMTKLQVIPLLRLSEMYLIMMETTNDLTEGNLLWQTYELSHNLQVPANKFASLEALRAEIVSEYRREFFGEGQMFFTYKRLNIKNMLWKTTPVTEGNYVIPLPQTEFNPNKF